MLAGTQLFVQQLVQANIKENIRTPHHWTFVRDSPHRLPVHVDITFSGLWHRALMFHLMCAWTNCWPNKRDAGDLRCHGTHYYIAPMHLGLGELSWHLDAWTKWLPFCRQHFQMHLFAREFGYFDSNFTEVCSQISNWRWIAIGSGYNLAIGRQQTLFETMMSCSYQVLVLPLLVKMEAFKLTVFTQG